MGQRNVKTCRLIISTGNRINKLRRWGKKIGPNIFMDLDLEQGHIFYGPGVTLFPSACGYRSRLALSARVCVSVRDAGLMVPAGLG